MGTGLGIRRWAVGVLAGGMILGAAPTAVAAPVPDPDPVPVPQPDSGAGFAGCQGTEVMQDGNCVPAMAPVVVGDEPTPEPPLRLSDDYTSTTVSGLPTDLVPNLDGTPCTGYWMSGACYAMTQDQVPAVVPRSTLSDSP